MRVCVAALGLAMCAGCYGSHGLDGTGGAGRLDGGFEGGGPPSSDAGAPGADAGPPEPIDAGLDVVAPVITCADDEVVLQLREPRTDDDARGCMTVDVRGGGSRECGGFAVTTVRVTAPATLDVGSITFQTTLLEVSGSVRGAAYAVVGFDPASCECTGAGTIGDSDAMVGDTTFTGFGLPHGTEPAILLGLANPGALYRVEACFSLR